MKEISGWNIWGFHNEGQWIVVTTNNTVTKDGHAVMGRGIALEAAKRFTGLTLDLGARISVSGGCVHALEEYRLFCMPVKEHWRNAAIPKLIRRSAEELVEIVDALGLKQVYSVRPGCGNGGLSWDVVRPWLEPIWDDRFTIVERRG